MNLVPLSLTNKKAAIFDMDGTMIENMPFHEKAWMQFAEQKGRPLTLEDFNSLVRGKTNAEIMPALFERDFPKEELAEYADQKETLYRELYAPYIAEVQGLKLIINLLKEKGLKLGIATSAPKANRDWALSVLELNDAFDAVVGDEHASQGKPHPEIYLNAAKQLGVDPKDCIAFEDSMTGIKSAKAAGMLVVALLTSHQEHELHDFDVVVHNFTQLDLHD